MDILTLLLYLVLLAPFSIIANSETDFWDWIEYKFKLHPKEAVEISNNIRLSLITEPENWFYDQYRLWNNDKKIWIWIENRPYADFKINEVRLKNRYALRKTFDNFKLIKNPTDLLDF